MNKKDVLELIKKYLGSILYHELLIAELLSELAGTGAEDKVFKLLILRLRQLATLGVHATRLEEFENLGDGLFSMHLAGKGVNIRILYSFLSNKKPVLLLAFYERGGKKNTAYANHIAPAQARLKQIKEGYRNV